MTIKQQGGIFGRNPTFNDVDVEGTLTVNGEPISDFGTMAQQDADAVAITGGSGAFDTFSADTDTLYVDAPNDRVGINTSNPTTAFQANTGAGGFGTFFHQSGAGGIRIVGSAGASGANLVLANDFNSGGDDRWAISLNGGNDALSIASGGVASALGGSGTERVTVDTSGNMELKTGNLVVSSGKGVDFSATSGTGTSELFDDYEEGTWTVTDNSGAGLTFTNNTGYYTKVGRFVTAIAAFTFPSTADGSNASISGLPFTTLDAQATRASGVITYSNFSSSHSVWLYVARGGTSSLFIDSAANAKTNANLSGKTFYVQFNYQT